jgi:tetratricopeptide (TPR) repeat protein
LETKLPETKGGLNNHKAAQVWIAALLPVFATFLAFLPLLNNGFLNLDDHQYILDNPHIRVINGDFFRWCFTTFYEGNWIPLSWISLGLDYALGRLHPWVYHLHSLVLHGLNTLLVFFLSLRLLGLAGKNGEGPQAPPQAWALSGAFLASLLFGLHPLHVESTAWANEQRDLLCGFFYLLSLWFYLARKTQPGKKGWAFWGALVCFAFSLMSKPMAVSLPFVLLLLDLWPLQRVRAGNITRLFGEKIPFFLLSLVVIVTAPLAQAENKFMEMNNVLPLGYRVMNAFHSLMFYLWKMILPLGLHPFYPFDRACRAFTPENLVSILLVFAVSAACFLGRKRRPWLGAAWAYYVLTLLPVLGLVQTGNQAAADRFTYLPSLAPFLLAGAGLSFFVFRNKSAVLASGLALGAVLGFLTFRQLAVWHDDISFFGNITRFCPEDPARFHTFLDQAYRAAGRYNDALAESEKAESLTPEDPAAHFNMGSNLLNLNRNGEAIAEFQRALQSNPRDPYSHLNLAIAYQNMGMAKEGLAELEKAVEADPRCFSAYRDLGVYYQNQHQWEKSEGAFKSALALKPDNMECMVELADTYGTGGKYREAFAYYGQGLQLQPNDPVLWAHLGMTYARKGESAKALEALGNAEGFAPQSPEFFVQLGQDFSKLGEKAKAAECLAKARFLKKTAKPQ